MTDWLTTEEAGEYLRTSADYIARQCANGVIRARKISTQWRVTREALDAFMATDVPPTRVRHPKLRRAR